MQCVSSLEDVVNTAELQPNSVWTLRVCVDSVGEMYREIQRDRETGRARVEKENHLSARKELKKVRMHVTVEPLIKDTSQMRTPL